MLPKFILFENFSWLIGQLKSFVDPNISYSKQGMPSLKGGNRRIYRYQQHYDLYYKAASVKKTPPPVNINFGSSIIECDKWLVTHSEFEDPQLKEKFPVPTKPYSVLITSKHSLENGTAKRYYVSCSCMDFDTTFKQELINYGYTSDDGSLPPATGTKKLAPAICKHIYAVLMLEYADLIKKIDITPEQSAEIYPSQSSTAPQLTTSASSEAKTEAKRNILKTLSFLSNRMSNSVEVYKNTRSTSPAYKKYKFMIRKYPQGYAIVFTNPLLNPFRDKNRDKEIVPILNWETRSANQLSSPISYYSKFSKDELLDLIKTTRIIQPNQINTLNSTVKKYTLTENLDLTLDLPHSISMEILDVLSC